MNNHGMGDKKHRNAGTPPLGSIEPHAQLLNRPTDDQLLYKVMRIEDLLRSISGAYLHFNRVNSYKDFHGADARDGQQLPKDRHCNLSTRFAKAPEFSAANYYDQPRSRTYACCFSVVNSDFIWHNYGNGGEKGKVCVVFEFGKLRSTLNKTLQAGQLEYGGIRCHQIFSINYGLIEHVEWESFQANTEYLANPIKYTYYKNTESFGEEQELRVSLSAPGIGQFGLNDGSTMGFPTSLPFNFDFRVAGLRRGRDAPTTTPGMRAMPDRF